MIASAFRITFYMVTISIAFLCVLLFAIFVKYKTIDEPQTRTVVAQLMAIPVGQSMENVLRVIEGAHVDGTRNGPNEVIVRFERPGILLNDVHLILYRFDAKGKLKSAQVVQSADGP